MEVPMAAAIAAATMLVMYRLCRSNWQVQDQADSVAGHFSNLFGRPQQEPSDQEQPQSQTQANRSTRPVRDSMDPEQDADAAALAGDPQVLPQNRMKPIPPLVESGWIGAHDPGGNMRGQSSKTRREDASAGQGPSDISPALVVLSMGGTVLWEVTRSRVPVLRTLPLKEHICKTCGISSLSCKLLAGDHEIRLHTTLEDVIQLEEVTTLVLVRIDIEGVEPGVGYKGSWLHVDSEDIRR
eukprot:CAMPEP_0197638836 /NCGR_PEP_ID=MMETSP1338-20131121/13650_1 /TAXON_ID=43686 ORGANISM="Pelagodinium beii, Strain RCC1491" /NCGR_SAMPLE_ID=MMETSP1338 /ASSEMBLY_ACC=CAM_ASM_000754 /LENGTH=239 /DNA_ID=CAMNT_0043211485 /DNA_START=128 /DNA_END=843 /DNA_ORIENTATION=+